MATKGQILINKESGDVFEFIETANDTNGERLKIKITLKSKGALIPPHLHVLQDEHFEVLDGKLTVELQGKKSVIAAGDNVLLPKAKGHNHYNGEDTPVIYIQTVTPAMDVEHFFETIVGLANDGKLKNGKAGLVQELVVLKYLDAKAYLAGMPVGLQEVLMNIVAPLARKAGYRAVYKKYSGIEK